MNGFNDNKWDEVETERLSKSGQMHQDQWFRLEESFITNWQLQTAKHARKYAT